MGIFDDDANAGDGGLQADPNALVDILDSVAEAAQSAYQTVTGVDVTNDASGGMSAGTDGGYSTSGTAPQPDASSSPSDGGGGMSGGTDGGYSTSGTTPNSSSASEPAPPMEKDWDDWSSDLTNGLIDGVIKDLGVAATGVAEGAAWAAGKVLDLETDNPEFMKTIDPATGLPRTDAGPSDTSPGSPAGASHAFDLSAPTEAVSAVDVGEISPNFVDGNASSAVGPTPMDESDLDEASAPAPTLESEPADVNYPLGETSAPSTFDGSYPTLGETSAPPDVEYPEGETSYDSPPEFSEEPLYHDDPAVQNPAADGDLADVGVIDVEESYDDSSISCTGMTVEDPFATADEIF